MSELISGKEALIALANGEEVEARNNKTGNEWDDAMLLHLLCFKGDMFEFRLKPKTININGIEVPAPFKPEVGEEYYYINTGRLHGYSMKLNDGKVIDDQAMQFGAWRTEEEIKQVVSALRSILNVI